MYLQGPAILAGTCSALVFLLETAHEGKLDPKTAVTMVQSALLLMGDASQHQSASHRETILKQLNPQIVDLIKEEDYTKALPFSLGEDFEAKVKTRMEEAAALKKTLSQSSKGKERQVFMEATLERTQEAAGVADQMFTALDHPRNGDQPLPQATD